MSRPRIDILIPTLNEAPTIAQAVANAAALGRVFVLDSLSTDGTQALARTAGATVVEHPFTDYAAQKNWGLNNLPFEGEWIFILDADERITPALRQEIFRRLERPNGVNGFYVNRLFIFMGRAIRHGGMYPSWNLRLFRRGKAYYEDRRVHEHMVCQGKTDYLRQEMLHIRREGIEEFIAKHIRYADMESDEWVKWRLGRSDMATADSLFKDMLKYRQWVRRHVWPRLPYRPLWRLFYMYVARMGFLDGAAGWHLARLMSSYEYMISRMYDQKLLQANAERPVSDLKILRGSAEVESVK
jgi:glycosyltransferase involved in cell wall biosynthesis